MKGQLIWDNAEKTILRQVYEGAITVEDIKEMATKTYEMLSELPHTVHLIIETISPARANRNAFIQASRTLDKTVATNQGLVVIVDTSIATKFSIKAMGLSAPKAAKNVQTVGSLEDARELIKHYMSSK